jgi:hypothetical protein
VSESTPSSPQPQESFGSAPGPSESFGSAPVNPAGQAGPAMPGTEPAAPAKKSPWPRIGILAAVVVVVVGIGLFLNRNNATNAKVGDCFATTMGQEGDASNEKTVDCNGPDAAYKVLSILDGKTKEELNPDANCATLPTADSAIWLGEQGKQGKIYCVQTLKK